MLEFLVHLNMLESNVVMVLLPVPGFPSISNDGIHPHMLVISAKF